MNISEIFTDFSKKLILFFQEIENSKESWHSEHVREMPTKFHQILTKNRTLDLQNANFEWIILNKLFKTAKIVTRFFWNFAIWAVQRIANLVDLEKSSKMSTEYLVAIVAVHTAENEPLKVWGWFHSFFIRLLTVQLAVQLAGRLAAKLGELTSSGAPPTSTRVEKGSRLRCLHSPVDHPFPFL